jgi:hypothetical protein
VDPLAVAGEPVARHRRLVADRRVREPDARLLVDEIPVGPVRARDGRGLDRLERLRRQPAGGEVRERDPARLRFRELRAGRVLAEHGAEADELAEGRDRDPLLLELARAEPAHLPDPDLRGAAVELARPLETELPLEVDLRVLLDQELRREPRAPDVAAALREHLLAEAPRAVAVHAKLDPRLGEGAAEERPGDRGARDDHEEAREDEAQVAPVEPLQRGPLHR